MLRARARGDIVFDIMDAPPVVSALLIFDLDGTLYRTESSFVPTMRRVYEAYDVPYPGDAAVLHEVGETFETFIEWLRPQGFAVDPQDLQRHIAEWELEGIRTQARLFDGVADTLRLLEDRGHILTICTNGDRRYAEAVLGTCRVLERFRHLSTIEADRRTKTQRVAELCRLFPHQRPIVVGDRYHDVAAGKSNGCTVVGAGYGYARDGELDEADYIIPRFSDLLLIV